MKSQGQLLETNNERRSSNQRYETLYEYAIIPSTNFGGILILKPISRGKI